MEDIDPSEIAAALDANLRIARQVAERHEYANAISYYRWIMG